MTGILKLAYKLLVNDKAKFSALSTTSLRPQIRPLKRSCKRSKHGLRQRKPTPGKSDQEPGCPQFKHANNGGEPWCQELC